MNLKKTRVAEGNLCIGNSHGGRTTKVHALVNPFGLPIRLSISAGNREDFDETIPLLAQLDTFGGCDLLGDKAYGTKNIRGYLQEHGTHDTIPPTKNLREPWLYNHDVNRRRNVIERFFCRLRAFRRVNTRYDKRASPFAAVLLISAISISFSILHI